MNALNNGTIMLASAVIAGDEIKQGGYWYHVTATEYDADGSPEVCITIASGERLYHTSTDRVEVR